MYTKEEFEDLYFMIEYSFRSRLNNIEGSKYISEYTGTIYNEDEELGKKEVAGMFQFTLLNLKLALDDDYSYFVVFDQEEYLLQMGQELFDFDEDDYNEMILTHYDVIFNHSVGYISSIEILPEYRGHGLCRDIIKNIYYHFSSSCGMIVLKAVPLQFESEAYYDMSDEWGKKMKYHNFEVDEETSKYKLLALFKKCHFELIPGISEEYMFIDTNKINPFHEDDM